MKKIIILIPLFNDWKSVSKLLNEINSQVINWMDDELRNLTKLANAIAPIIPPTPLLSSNIPYVSTFPESTFSAKTGNKVGNEPANIPVSTPIRISATMTLFIRMYDKPDRRSRHGLWDAESVRVG